MVSRRGSRRECCRSVGEFFAWKVRNDKRWRLHDHVVNSPWQLRKFEL